MKKNFNRLLLSVFIILIMFSVIGSTNGVAAGNPNQIINVQGDSIQTQLQSNFRTMFCFQERTRLTICSNIGLNLEIECDALRIGDNDVIIEIEGEGDLTMTMTCTREESQLGLMNGSLHRARNRNMYRYLEGFCISIACNSECNCQCKCDPLCTCECDCQCKCDSLCTCECDCQCKCDPEFICNPDCPNEGSFLKATLRIRATNQNRLSQWAYFDEHAQEWVTVSTINEDNYLTAETTSLSTWTLLAPEMATSTMGGTIVIITVSALGILAISVLYLKKRR